MQLPGLNAIGAGLVISLVGGCVATLAMSRLAARWWGEAASRRAILFFCLFPGTIMFSMIYSEGVELAFVALGLLMLEDRRWVAAGICGGLAAATTATAAALIPVAAIAALVELYRHRHRGIEAWRSLAAPVLTALGLICFGVYLWIHAGTPFATILAQRNAWDQKSTPLAIPHLISGVFGRLLDGQSAPAGSGPWGDDLNDFNGLIGLCVLLWALWLQWGERHRMHFTAIAWTVAIFLLTVTSPTSPPNARMLTAAFPALLVIGAKVTGRRSRRVLIGIEVLLALGMSWLTYGSGWLRP